MLIKIKTSAYDFKLWKNQTNGKTNACWTL